MKKRLLAYLMLGVLNLTAAYARADETAPTGPSEPSLAEVLGSPENSAALDRLTESPETLNKATLLHLGMRSRPVRLRLLEEAQNYLFITVPYWFNDEGGNEFLEAVKAKQAGPHKIDFRVLMDWSSPVSDGDLTADHMYKKIKEVAEGKAHLWNRLWDLRPWSDKIWKNRIHDKMFVVDGKKLIMGGMNIADDYLQGGTTEKGWHDTDVLLEGPIASEASRHILAPWLLQDYLIDHDHHPFPSNKAWQVWGLQQLFYHDNGDFTFPTTGLEHLFKKHEEVHIPMAQFARDPKYYPDLSGEVKSFEAQGEHLAPARLIYDNPLVDRTMDKKAKHYSKLFNTFQYVFPQARHSIRMFIPYLTTTDEMNDLLIAQAKRGVKVQIITNSLQSIDMGVMEYRAGLVNSAKLVAAGVEVYEWQGHKDLAAFKRQMDCTGDGYDSYWWGNTIHTKGVIIDGTVALLGSNNMNTRSELYNSEVMVLVRDPKFASELNAVFEEDLDAEYHRLYVSDASLPMTGSQAPLQCGDLYLIGRPPRTVKLDLPYLRERVKKFGIMPWFLHLFQGAM